MEGILDFGVKIVAAIQSLGGWLEAPMKFFSFLGTEDFFMFVLPVLFWCVDLGLGLRVGVILLSSACINEALKIALHAPRPYWYSTKVQGLAAESSFGVPSGHAQHALGVWGMLAARIKRSWAWIAAALIIFFIGFSRIYLGVHFLHDVLVGWLIGAFLLWATLSLWAPAAGWLQKQTTLQQILLGLAFSLLLLLPSLLARGWLTVIQWEMPSTWLKNAMAASADGPLPNPASLEGPVSNAGTIFGLALGLALLVRQGGFQTKGEWWKLILRFLVGVAGVFIIRYGLKAIFPEGESALAFSLRYVRYACIGAWVTGGAPWLFLRLKLAERNRESSSNV